MRAPWNRARLDWFASACHKSSGGGTTTTVQDSGPWSGQQPYLIPGFQAASSDVLNRPLEYYPESTVVPFSSQTQDALGAQEQRARQGSPLLGQAQDYTSDVLAGQYNEGPESNPFYNQLIDSVQSSVQPSVDSRFSSAGRGGSALHTEALGRGVARGVAPAAYQNYGNERALQQAASQNAIPLGREDYYDPGQLANVGRAYEGKSEEGLAEDIARFNFGQSEPTNRIAQYMNLIQGNYGASGTTTQSAKNEVNSGLLYTGTAMRALGAK